MESLHFVTLTIRVDCPRCGQPVPVNGPLKRVPCPSCGASVELGPFLPDAITLGSQGGGLMLNGAHVKEAHVREARACCHACEEPFDAELQAAAVERGSVPCPGCGAACRSVPAPDWLAAELPGVVALLDARLEVDGASAFERATEPIAFECPKCRGPLQVGPESARTLECAYCRASVYIPDGLWRRLHPVPIALPWTLAATRRPLITALEQRREERLARQREQEREQEEAERQRRADERQAELRRRIEEKERAQAQAREERRRVTRQSIFVSIMLLVLGAWLAYTQLAPD